MSAATPLQRERPRLAFIGIHSGGRPGMNVSQNETLARLFTSAGYRTRKASAVRRPLPRTLHQVASLLLWRNVEVVVVAVFSGDSFWIADFSTVLARATGKRVVLFLHGGNLPTFGPQHRKRVERTLSRGDAVLAPSDYLASTFREWGLDVHVVPNVLELGGYEYRHRTSARPRLLWMRTFHEHYDPLMAVRVMRRVVDRVPDATLTMAGLDHGLLGATTAEADRLGLAGSITFPGYIGTEEKLAALRDHDVFLNTNVVDNMPVSILEAAASGLVPVATAVGGIPAMVHDGVDALLVPSGDDAAMAEAVLDLLDDDTRYAQMSAAARAFAERSDWPQVRLLWEEHLRRIVPWKVWS